MVLSVLGTTSYSYFICTKRALWRFTLQLLKHSRILAHIHITIKFDAVSYVGIFALTLPICVGVFTIRTEFHVSSYMRSSVLVMKRESKYTFHSVVFHIHHFPQKYAWTEVAQPHWITSILLQTRCFQTFLLACHEIEFNKFSVPPISFLYLNKKSWHGKEWLPTGMSYTVWCCQRCCIWADICGLCFIIIF